MLIRTPAVRRTCLGSTSQDRRHGDSRTAPGRENSERDLSRVARVNLSSAGSTCNEIIKSLLLLVVDFNHETSQKIFSGKVESQSHFLISLAFAVNDH